MRLLTKVSFTRDVIKLDFPLPSSPQTQIRTTRRREVSRGGVYSSKLHLPAAI
jgi:hypothetical protein